MTVFLYALHRVDDDEVRYIGITDDPPRRLQQHCGPYSRSPVHAWARDGGVSMDVLAAFDTREEAAMAEIEEIARRRALGERLLNLHPGGTGGQMTDEAKAKISAALRERVVKDSTREKMRQIALARPARPGKAWTDEQRAALRATLARRTPEERARVSANIAAAKRGRPRPDVSERNRHGRLDAL